jgi:serine protease Do
MSRLLSAIILALAILLGSIGGAIDIKKIPGIKEIAKTKKKRVTQKTPETPNEHTFMVLDGRGHGTGWMLTEDLLVTNYHVVEYIIQNKNTVLIQDNDLNVFKGDVVRTDPASDLALVKLRDGVKKPYLNLDFDKISKEQDVYVTGFGGGVWYGHLEGKIAFKYFMDIEVWNIKSNVIVMDLPIWPGFSGSPILDAEGEVVGVVSMGDGTICLAIPAENVRAMHLAYLNEGEKILINPPKKTVINFESEILKYIKKLFTK